MKEITAVVLAGHGAPALDCPPQLVGELMGIEWMPGSGHSHAPALEVAARTRPWAPLSSRSRT